MCIIPTFLQRLELRLPIEEIRQPSRPLDAARPQMEVEATVPGLDTDGESGDYHG